MALITTRRRSKRYGPATSGTRRYRRDRITKVWRLVSDGRGPHAGINGTQITTSENHRWPPRKGQFSGDIGGPFSTTRTRAVLKGSQFSEMRSFSSGSDDLQSYITDHAMVPWELFGSPMPTSLQSSNEDLEAMGATAVARVSPTNGASNVLTAIGEIVKDGLPFSQSSRNWQNRAQTARSAGSEYLNAQFGWLPLVDDILKFADAVKNTEAIMAQYERDMGRLVRRKYQFPSLYEKTSEVDPDLVTHPAGVSSFPGSAALDPITPGRLVRTSEKRIDTWFSGAFSYGIPLNSTSREGAASLAAEADKLFGISLTPDVLWELAPWSWAIDWFSNVGDVLANISDGMSQGLVMHYGYVMEKTVHTHTYTVEGLLQGGKPVQLPPVRIHNESKTRVKANPFGFGVSWDGLSPFQLSILAALGITRT